MISAFTVAVVIIIVLMVVAVITILAIAKNKKEVRCNAAAMVTGLKGVDKGDAGYSISWNEVPGATSYTLYVAATPFPGHLSVDDLDFSNPQVQIMNKIVGVTNPYLYPKNHDNPRLEKSYIAVTSVFAVDGKTCESPFGDSLAVNSRMVKIDAPLLRCYDHFQFPPSTSVDAKTCGLQQSPLPTRMFIQWFPVDDAVQYNVYLNAGPTVTTTIHSRRWSVPATTYYFESDVLTGPGCWSMAVSAVSKNGFESNLSQTFTTCEV